MDDERATAILGRYGDHDHMVNVLMTPSGQPVTPEQVELAEALAFDWRKHADDPGFNQPEPSLLGRVEALIGEAVYGAERDVINRGFVARQMATLHMIVRRFTPGRR